MSLIEHIISNIAPHKCVQCQQEGSLLCDLCARKLMASIDCCEKCKDPRRSLAPAGCVCHKPLNAVYAAAPYNDAAKQLVWRLKFNRAIAASRHMATLCSPLVPHDTTVVCHVPTANQRIRVRGYDQAQRIARSVAQYTGLPHLALLARLSAHRQVGADAATRRQQLNHAFRPLALSSIAGAKVVLVDDVITTGATLESAAQVLLDHGAARVDAVVFARA